MAYTAYSQAWLEDQSTIKGILVEVVVRDVVASTEITLYLSNIGFITSDSLVSYLPIVTNGISFTETLPIDGSPTMTFGDIEIANPNGDYDAWLDPTKYVWVNRDIKIYLGDPLFVCANLAAVHTNFEMVYWGITTDIDSKDRAKLNIKLADKLNRLNAAVTTSKVGTYGTWSAGQTNQDTILPVVFGEIFNTIPLLIDPSTMEYQVNLGPMESLIELRDNGVPIYTTGVLTTGATVNLTTGKFKLINPLIGTLTASVQGVQASINLTTGALQSTYSNNIASLVALISTQYGIGKLSTTTEIDLVNLKAFSLANTQSVGIQINDTTSVLSACQQIANSVGAQLFMTRKGQLQLLRIGNITTDTVVAITESDFYHHTLNIISRSTVNANYTISYCKNWAVQSNLVTAVPPEDKTSFSTDVLLKNTLDTNVQTLYKLAADSLLQKDTLLIIGSEAQAESTRLNNIYKVPRTIYSFQGTFKLLSLKLGQGVTITHSRFGLSGTVSGQVVSLSPDWINGKIAVEVMI